MSNFWGAVQTASAFFVLRTQRNRNPRKVTHPVSWARSGNARYVPKSSAQSRRGPPAQGFAACLRTQPRRVSQPGFGVQFRFYLSSLHYSTPRLGGAGTGKLRFAEIFGAAICAFDKLGANYRYLSVRRHALRRSLALAADKAPLSPPNGGIPSFVKKEAKSIQNRLRPILSAGGYLPPTRLRRRSVKKCYRHLKFRAVIPARCPGSAGANFTDNGLRKILEIFHSPVPARCLTDIRISTDEGAITQAQSYPKRGITPCPSSGRLYVRRIPADPVTFFL